MGWSPDGRYLLFATDRTGSTGLWALRMLDGKPQGAPEQVKSDIGSSWSLGLTSNGTMYVWKDTRAPYVQVSEIDLKAGTLGRNVFQEFISSRGRPDWSADGKHLAYVPCASLGDGPCSLRIWSADTGRTRDVRHKLRYLFFPRWSPDGVSLLASGTNPKGRGSVYRIDVQTGDTIPLTDFRAGNPQWAADGQHIYYPRPRGQNGGRIIVKRTLFSGQESDLVQSPDYATDFLVSRDGRSVVFPVSEPSRPSTIVVTSSNGGESRVLARANPRERWGFLASWTPDGSAVLVAKMFADSDHKELWLVPLTGEPRKLNIDADAWNVGDGFRLSPDGRHIAFVGQAGKSNTEIWALENVVPNGKSSGR